MPYDTIDVLGRQAELGHDPEPDLPPAAIVQVEAVRPEPPLIGSDRAWTVGKPAGRLERLPRSFYVAALALAAAAALFFFLGKAVMGAGDASSAPATDAVGTEPAAAAPVVPPAFQITEAVITKGLDPATGAPGVAVDAIAPGDSVYLWFSFTSDGSGGSVNVTWRRGARSVARTETVLPVSSSTMSVPLAGTATERPGTYLVQIRHGGDVVAERTFEVTNG